MRKILFSILIGFLFFQPLKAQYVNIPDSNFRNFLIGKYPSCFDAQGRMDTTCSLILNEKKLDSFPKNFVNPIKSLNGIEYFKTLDTLICDSINGLSNIDILPNSLRYLDLRNNNIFNLKMLPSNLYYLNLDDNNLSCLPKLPDSLKELNITNNYNLYCIPNRPKNLVSSKQLCTFNSGCLYFPLYTQNYFTIPDDGFGICLYYQFPNAVKYDTAIMKFKLDTTSNDIINCSDLIIAPYQSALISNIDGFEFFKNLTRLVIINVDDQIEFNFKQSFLSILNIFNCNKLQKISGNLKFLGSLEMSNNKEFYDLPENFYNLYNFKCVKSKISKLPKFSNNLFELDIVFNENFKCLPRLPDSLKVVSIDFPGNVTCFTELNTSYDYRDNNYQKITNLPICNSTNNINNCHSLPKIQSFIYTDENSNGNYNINEKPKQNLKLKLSNTNISYTDREGKSTIYSDSLGTYTITPQAKPLFQILPSNYTHTFNKYDTIVYDTFALQPLIIKDSVAIKITPINWAARPGFNYAYNVNFENVGTTILNPTVKIVLDTNKYIYDSCSYSNAVFNGNTLTTNISNFTLGQNESFTIYGKLKPTAQLGSNLIATANIVGGSATANDTISTNIRGSYDPNYKQATPNLSVTQVASDNTFIDYTIRFQNTGTDTAFTVVVADTLNTNKLQVNSLQITQASHNCTITQNDNIVYFEFRNILLPDSTTNKIGSNGFVSFKAKPKTTLTNGEVVPNSAAIYFDYNSPIITNTAQTFIGTLPLTLLNFTASPTPPKEGLTNILLYWNTANEVNTSHFVIEQSSNAKEFKAIAEVNAIGKGENNYYSKSTVDSRLSTVYYRLKMIDKDGKFVYSKIVEINLNQNNVSNIKIKSPTSQNLQIFSTAKLNHSTAFVFNGVGKQILQIKLQQGWQQFNISNLSKGVYYLKYEGGVEKFVVE